MTFNLMSNYIYYMKIDNTFFLIGRIKEHYTAFLEKELKNRGLNRLVTSHADIIVALRKSGELTLSEVADSINRDRSTVTSLVSKLESLGYVQQRKNEDDNRSRRGKAAGSRVHKTSRRRWRWWNRAGPWSATCNQA